MSQDWDPRAKPPQAERGSEFLRWFAGQLSAFQRSRPDLPQQDIATLSARRCNQVVRAWNRAREEAELEDVRKATPEMYDLVKRAHRTRTISVSSTKQNKAKGRKR